MNETLNILKELATSNTINFAIMAILLGVIIKKLHLSTAFEKSIEVIKNQISNSETEKANSSKILGKNKDLIEKLPNELEEMEKTSQSKLTAFEEKIEDNTRKTIENLVLATDRIKTIEEKKVSNLLTQSTSKEALELAKNRICELLEKNPEMHNDFIQQSIDELDKVKI